MKTENMILCFLFILLQCQIGHTLKCYKCSDDCSSQIPVNCSAGEQCASWSTRDGGKWQKGCLKSQDCNRPESGGDTTKYCCNTDLCNAATLNTTSSPTTNQATGQSRRELTCRSCDHFGCLVKYTTVCKPDERCVTQHVTMGSIPMTKHGCTDPTKCSKLTTEVVAGFSVSVNNLCCDEDLCNN